MQNQTLYDALLRLPLEATGGRYTFLCRLCRENGWNEAEGRGAIAEYRRFLYLATVSSVPVTPPPKVDQVWHLHLVYTRPYWEELCQGILGRPLHHGPTAGGPEEDAKFADWYRGTLALYRDEFGEEAPAGVWPGGFSAESRSRWIDEARNWVIPKPRWGSALPGVFPLLLIDSGAAFLLVLVAVGFIALMVKLFTGEGSKTQKNSGAEGGCSAFADIGGDGGGDSSCGDSGGGDCGGGDGGGGCGGGGCGGGGD